MRPTVSASILAAASIIAVTHHFSGLSIHYLSFRHVREQAVASYISKAQVMNRKRSKMGVDQKSKKLKSKLSKSKLTLYLDNFNEIAKRG